MKRQHSVNNLPKGMSMKIKSAKEKEQEEFLTLVAKCRMCGMTEFADRILINQNKTEYTLQELREILTSTEEIITQMEASQLYGLVTEEGKWALPSAYELRSELLKAIKLKPLH
jgi:hypothetical protein